MAIGLARGSPATTSRRWRPEMEVVLSTARTRLSAERAERLRSLCRAPLDWDVVIAEARRHGVDPLLHRHLRAIAEPGVPRSVIDRLRAHAETNAVRNRLLAVELGKVLARLEREGIAAIPYKGPILAALVYQDVGLRRCADLDVLVRRRDVLRSKAALAALGYAPRLRLTAGQERAYLASQCEYALDRDRGRLTVEIHWDIAPRDFAFRFDLERLWRGAHPASVNGTVVRVPQPDDLLLMLIVHGSKHLWDRAGWLVDIAEMVDAHPDMDWPSLLGRARERGGARMVLVALTLAAGLLDARVPDAVRRVAERDAPVVALATRITDWLGGGGPAPRSPAAFRAHLALRERRRDRTACLLRSALTPTVEDWASLRLPAWLLPAHYLLRPFRLVAKRVLTATGEASTSWTERRGRG